MGGKRNTRKSSSDNDHNLEVAELKRIIETQHAAIQKLTSRVNTLEGKMCRKLISSLENAHISDDFNNVYSQ